LSHKKTNRASAVTRSSIFQRFLPFMPCKSLSRNFRSLTVLLSCWHTTNFSSSGLLNTQNQTCVLLQVVLDPCISVICTLHRYCWAPIQKEQDKLKKLAKKNRLLSIGLQEHITIYGINCQLLVQYAAERSGAICNGYRK